MSRFSAITDNPHEGRFNKKTGILVTNLGSPDAPTPKALRVYLAEFLSEYNCMIRSMPTECFNSG